MLTKLPEEVIDSFSKTTRSLYGLSDSIEKRESQEDKENKENKNSVEKKTGQESKINVVDKSQATARESCQKLKEIRSFDSKHATAIQESLRDEIKRLRRAQFEFYTQDEKGHEVLIKDQVDGSSRNPIDPNEAHIQALRYLDGMLLLAAYSENSQYLNHLNNIFNLYLKYIEIGRKQAEVTTWLANQLANLLRKEFKNKGFKSQKMLCALRDFTQLIQAPTVIVTVTRQVDKTILVEKAEPVPLDEFFYEKKQLIQWQDSMIEYCGLDKKRASIVKGLFATFGSTLQTQRVSIPPSSRFAPGNGNHQLISRKTYDANSVKTSDYCISRCGTATSFAMKSSRRNYQEEMVERQIYFAMNADIVRAIEDYKREYKGLLPKTFEFFIEYKTLLSPIKGEEHLKHSDNNGRFVAQKVAAFKKIKEQYKAGKIFTAFKEVTLVFSASNSAVNDLAVRDTALKIFKGSLKSAAALLPIEEYNDSADFKMTTHAKLVFNATFFSSLNTDGLSTDNERNKRYKTLFTNVSSYLTSKHRTRLFFPSKSLVDNYISILESKELTQLAKGAVQGSGIARHVQMELARRIKASVVLKLITNDLLLRKVPKDLRNIFTAALEFIALGKSSMEILGCKSARDRTALVFAAINVLTDNVNLIYSPARLLSAMISDIERGHHTRAMIDHVAIVKLDDVRKVDSIQQTSNVTEKKLNHPYSHFTSTELQHATKSLKKFVKAIKTYKAPTGMPSYGIALSQLDAKRQKKQVEDEKKVNPASRKKNYIHLLNIDSQVKLCCGDNKTLRSYFNQHLEKLKQVSDSEDNIVKLHSLSEEFCKTVGKKISTHARTRLMCEFFVQANRITGYIDDSLPLPNHELWQLMSNTGLNRRTKTKRIDNTLTAFNPQTFKEQKNKQAYYKLFHLSRLKVDLDYWVRDKKIDLNHITSKRGPSVLLLQAVANAHARKLTSSQRIFAHLTKILKHVEIKDKADKKPSFARMNFLFNELNSLIKDLSQTECQQVLTILTEYEAIFNNLKDSTLLSRYVNQLFAKLSSIIQHFNMELTPKLWQKLSKCQDSKQPATNKVTSCVNAYNEIDRKALKKKITALRQLQKQVDIWFNSEPKDYEQRKDAMTLLTVITRKTMHSLANEFTQLNQSRFESKSLTC